VGEVPEIPERLPLDEFQQGVIMEVVWAFNHDLLSTRAAPC
jgi:hypothetical protein